MHFVRGKRTTVERIPGDWMAYWRASDGVVMAVGHGSLDYPKSYLEIGPGE